MKNKTIDTLKDFLNVYWLRPETALWRTLDKVVMKDFAFKSPSLDLGCGDGSFSFLRAGGQFDSSFDAFLSVSELDKFFDNVDVYNHFKEDFKKPVVVNKPSYKIDVGLDHKEELLKKAKTLDLYNELVHHDANKPMPFEDNSFNTIFSNIVYWLDSPQVLFKEIKRILKPGGRAVVFLPNDTFSDYSFYSRLYLKTGDENWKWLEKIDRGRISDNIKHTYSSDHWEKMFKEAELNIESHKNYLSKTVIEAWDIGLRPIFPVLCNMVNKLTEKDKLEVKEQWINLVSDLIEPICKVEWSTDANYPPAFHYYELSNK